MLMVAGFNPWLAALAGIVFGAGLGLVNGMLVVGLRLPAIIVTLGTYSMFQGLSLVANQGRAIVPSDTSSNFFSIISTKLFGVLPVAALVFVVLAVVMHVVLHRTRFGYRVQAVGSNPEAAALRRHSDRPRPAADAGDDGRAVRPVGRHVCRLPRRHRPA